MYSPCFPVGVGKTEFPSSPEPQDMPVEDIECEDDPVPSAPPLSPHKIYPILPENSDMMFSPEVTTPTPTTTPVQVTPMDATPTNSPFPTSRSDFNMQRVRV